MEDISSIECLYEAVLKDFFLVFVKTMKKEEIKIENTTIKELLKDCLDLIKNPSISKPANAYYPEIYELLIKYLNDVNEFLEGKEMIENFPVIKVEEHDIYRAYGFLCGIRIMVEGLDLQNVSKFNYKENSNFKKFIDLYGNSKNLTINYEANFKVYQKDKKNLDLKLINKWIKKLDEKQLSPMKKKHRKKHKKNKDNTDKNINDTMNQNKIKTFEEKMENTNVIKDKINEDKNDIDVNHEKQVSANQDNIGDNEKASKESLEKKEEKNTIRDLGGDNENKIMILNMEGKSDNNISISKESDIEINNLSCKENGYINGEIPSNQNKIEENNKAPLVQLGDKNETINIKNHQDLPNIIMTAKNKEYNDDVSSISNKIEENKEASAMQGIEKDEIKIINSNLNSSISVQTTNNNEKKEDDNPIESLKKEMKELKEKMGKKIDNLEKEVNELKTGNGELNKRVKKLEINQLLLYHQISMYQTSRDMYKSIYTYYFKYLDLKRICPNSFEKLKAVIDYLNEKDTNKLKEKQYDDTKTVPENLKIKLSNYFKLHFFLNKVSNKIVHRNFSEEKKRIFKEQNNNDDNLLPLIPDFDFDQCFETLKYYVENSAHNKQLKKAMEIVYDEKYIKDEKLGPIRDDNGDVIKRDENGIHIEYKKEDLEEVRSHLKSINIENESFDKLCNDKLWDKEEKEDF